MKNYDLCKFICFVLLPIFLGFLEAEVFLPGRPRTRTHFPQRERSQWHSSGQKISADQKYQQIKKNKTISADQKTKKISADQKNKTISVKKLLK